jgi:toxin ParE1/3/4
MYTLQVDPLALDDIQEAYDYYEEAQIGLGEEFLDILDLHFASLENNPFYQVRYDEIRCLPISKFPYMIHFTIDEKNKEVIVWAVLNTFKDPDNWKKR